MRRTFQRDEMKSLIFGLTEKSAQFRNRWRGLAIMAVWLLLSGFTMLLTLFGVQTQLQVAIIIALSFLKYIPLLIVIYSVARKSAASYLADVYELEDEVVAASFLEEVTFGNGKENITINEGRINEIDERSALILIGGPGQIQVNLDSVALLEKVDGSPKVIYPRNEPWKVGTFERIREIGKFDEVGKREYAIINLRDQFVTGLSVKSRTKDGIPLEAQDIKVIFSILRRQQAESESLLPGDAYLFDEEAVHALVYNQTLITPESSAQSGITFPWDTTVIPLIISELEELISSRTLSEILASISQKEVDNASTNEQTIAKMRVEMTGSHPPFSQEIKESRAPNFETRSKITAQFFDSAFKEKAAKLGVSIEWIDIGTWELPSSLILDKHKEAWALSRENAKKSAAVEHSKKRHEMEELISLVHNVIIANYEKTNGSPARRNSDREVEAFFALNPEIPRTLVLPDTNKKETTTASNIAVEILKAFRKEMLAAKNLIENDGRPLIEKQVELIKISKALFDISHLTSHWIKK